MSEYKPDFITTPSLTLLDVLEEHGSYGVGRFLVHYCGMSVEDSARLVLGDLPITADLAARFEELLGVPSSFWLERERRYREWRVANGQT